MENQLLPPEPPSPSANVSPSPNINDNLDARIITLPQDLKTHIYRSHLLFDAEQKPICDEVLTWFQKSKEAQSLALNENVVKKVEYLLTNKRCVEYLRNHDKQFDNCYNDHYIRNQKAFVLMPRLESFALSILMYKYH